ncbi:hypothetical protein H4R20_002711 [Coemansia guatemalensis]|uniref:Peptidase S49 domain-containing protein n=1 Tax=Coemansia guatemalensis TaxID=2761395 RepID=A0A9W8I0Y7_9FUNG|nr:hypothetical protein H4R20_002711 [Coemansia guatemalensis]
MPSKNSDGQPHGPSKPPQNLLLWSAHQLWRFKKTAIIGSGAAYCYYRFQRWKLNNEVNNRIIDGTVLTWSITNGSIIETDTATSGYGPLGRVMDTLVKPSHRIRMLDALVALEMAAADPRVKSLIVRVHNGEDTDARSMSTGLGIAQTQELRQALERFQQRKEEQHGAGKGKSYFYIDSFDDQQTYYLASAFSDIVMQPTGYLPLTGISATQVYFKDLIDKLGIHMHVEARKDYKSVVAPFSQSSMPEKHRENMMDILESLNSTFIRDTARSCKAKTANCTQAADDDQPATAAEVMRRALEEGPISAPYAEKLGLITAQDYIFDLESIIGLRKAMSLSNYGKQRGKEHKASITSVNIGILDNAVLLNMHEQEGSSKRSLVATVGIVYLVGNIERHGTNSAERIAQHLLDAARDISVDAIVLRIDSGGGDVIASDTIGAAVDYIQSKFNKPVVASYGNMSASGAYYASTSCKRIFASPGTITGSIGVAAMRPIITRKLLDYIGTNVEELYVINNKSNSSFTEPQGSELERYRKLVDNIYEDFTKRVAKDRGYSNEDVEEVAQGRVFTGIQALSNGLVDEMGSFTRAIESAAEMGLEVLVPAKIKTLDRRVHLEKSSFLRQLVAMGHFKSVDEAEKSLINKPSDAEGKAANSADNSDDESNKNLIGAIIDKLGISSKDPEEPQKFFKGDITRNILLKEFPQQRELAKWVFDSINKKDDDPDGDFGFSPTKSARMSAQDAAKNVVVAALRDEINALLSGDSLRTLEKSMEQGRSVRAESDNTRFK